MVLVYSRQAFGDLCDCNVDLVIGAGRDYLDSSRFDELNELMPA